MRRSDAIARINQLWTSVWHARHVLSAEAYWQYRRAIVQLARINSCTINDPELLEVLRG